LTRFARFSPVRFDGKVADPHVRREAVRRFQDDDKTMLFVGNLAAAAAGLTLHRARYAIYESLSNQGAHYFQSLDRIHRRGQKREVEYIVLLCDRTIEQSEYDRLMVKSACLRLCLETRPNALKPVRRCSRKRKAPRGFFKGRRPWLPRGIWLVSKYSKICP